MLLIFGWWNFTSAESHVFQIPEIFKLSKSTWTSTHFSSDDYDGFVSKTLNFVALTSKSKSLDPMIVVHFSSSTVKLLIFAIRHLLKTVSTIGSWFFSLIPSRASWIGRFCSLLFYSLRNPSLELGFLILSSGCSNFYPCLSSGSETCLVTKIVSCYDSHFFCLRLVLYWLKFLSV